MNQDSNTGPTIWLLGGEVPPLYTNKGEHAALVERLNKDGDVQKRIIQDPTTRLSALNAVLQQHGLKLFEKPEQLGNWRQRGCLEVVGLLRIISDDPRYHFDVVAVVRLNDGKLDLKPMRWNANSAVSDGSVFVIIIDGRYLAVTRQWRLQLGAWTQEVPRGYGEVEDVNHLVGETLGSNSFTKVRGLATVMRELGEEIAQPGSLRVTSVTVLTRKFQNTGTDTAMPNRFLIMMEQIGSKRGRSTLSGIIRPASDEHMAQLWDIGNTSQSIVSKLVDDLSISTLTLAHLALRGLDSKISLI